MVRRRGVPSIHLHIGRFISSLPWVQDTATSPMGILNYLCVCSGVTTVTHEVCHMGHGLPPGLTCRAGRWRTPSLIPVSVPSQLPEPTSHPHIPGAAPGGEREQGTRWQREAEDSPVRMLCVCMLSHPLMSESL